MPKKSSASTMKLVEVDRPATLSPAAEAALDPGTRRELDRKAQNRMRQISPAGALGLPAKLDERRLRYGMVDDYFNQTVAFDKVYLYQDMSIDRWRTAGDTSIIVPETVQAGEAREAPRAIIIGAGLQALDALHGNGMELGDFVSFNRGIVSQIKVAWLNGEPLWCIVTYVGDICGNEDLTNRLRTGELKLERDADGKHFYSRQTGEALKAVEPFQKVNV